MANTHDDSTGWTAFFTYLQRRADKIVPLTAREQEAERLIFKEIHNGDLELRWLDIDGHVHIGLPRDWSGWYIHYDLYADAIRESRLFLLLACFTGRKSANANAILDQPADTAVEPEHADLSWAKSLARGATRYFRLTTIRLPLPPLHLRLRHLRCHP